MQDRPSGKIIGLDLGTTNSVVAYLDESTMEPVVIPHDHTWIYQANIMDIPDPFFQQEGTTYWLGVGVNAGWDFPPQTPAGLGWKSSLDHWGDPAVWDYGPAVDPVFWRQLADPGSGNWLDLAFVIVPEPSTGVMLLTIGATGLLAILQCRRKRSRLRAETPIEKDGADLAA